MDCSRFQDSISDYLESGLDSRARAEFATHRLCCRECRELFNDVRATVGALTAYGKREIAEPPELQAQILAATTAGEMLSCRAFDQLLERYFDGVILAPTFQTFQAHFEDCVKCRRLLAGIEEAIALCHEVKAAEVEMPHSLYDRIVAATVGLEEETASRWRRWGQAAFEKLLRPLWTPQWAAAALIFAASGFMITSRFGSVSGMASEAGAQAERLVTEGNKAINQTGTMAITGLQRVSSEFSSMLKDAKKAEKPVKAGPDELPPSPEPSARPDKTPKAGGPERAPQPEGKRSQSRRAAGGAQPG
jgi:predicted anti-sigma-YlaC factor YlaD